MRQLKENLLVQFSVTSLVILTAIALVLATVISNKVRSDAVNDLVEEAVGASSGRLLQAIAPQDLTAPMTGERYEQFDRFVEGSIVSDRTARVKLWGPDGTVIYANRQGRDEVGQKFPTKENLLLALGGQNAVEIKIAGDAENERERFLGTLMEVYAPIVFPGETEPAGAFEIYQYYQPTADRINTLRYWIFGPIGAGFLVLYLGLVTIVWRGWSTITNQQAQLKLVNEQLLQSQKMEAIGSLAGGVAHDFNNLLTPIIGHAHIGTRSLPQDHPALESLTEISKAATRAANLTHQLLAFSRRQIVEPQVLSLNELCLDLDGMLRRLIGEHIELLTLPSPDLRTIKADPGQIEQVLVNLVVNARDAMPEGGKITIGTCNVDIDRSYSSLHPDLPPGEYSMLSVSDTGSGMPPEVRERIFEPFFTTKEAGKGTGLGLATCYGIIKQNGGHVLVYSEPGQGTTFKVYLPSVAEEATHLQHQRAEETAPTGGSETVLLVEDDELVRTLACRILREQGYDLLPASNGVEALKIADEHGDEDIHILITDVVMPQMGGKELADRIKTAHPETRVLYTSGYTDDAIVHHGVLDAGVEFLAKPFSPRNLLVRVRETLSK